jgi:hypothetical protein
MTNEELTERSQILVSAILRLDARCDALALVVAALANHVGADAVKVFAGIEKAAETRHQELLSKIEDANPALAASLDYRVNPMPDLFD